jgi:quinol monooxygenase YgiN
MNSIVAQLRKEKGCRHAGFYQAVENEDDFLMVEDWATRADLDKHMESDIFTVLLGAGSLMQRPPDIVVHSVRRSEEVGR